MRHNYIYLDYCLGMGVISVRYNYLNYYYAYLDYYYIYLDYYLGIGDLNEIQLCLYLDY